MEAATGQTKAEGQLNGSLEKLRRIERAEMRLWFLAFSLFLLLAVSLFLLETSVVVEERAALGWTDRVLGMLKDYGLSGALLIVAWLICAYFFEKLVMVRRQNRDLVQALESTAQVLAHRDQQLATWSQLSHSLITNFHLPRLLDLIARTAAEVTESECAAVIVSESGSRHLRLAAIHERGLQIQLAERVAAAVIRDGTALYLAPGAPPEEFNRPDLPWDELVSLAAEPLVAAEKVVGALLVGRLKPHAPFSNQVLDTLESFANQASIALEKAQLYAENQKQLDRLGKLLDDLHATQAQLTEAEHVASLGVLSGGVAYVINNPVAGILARADRALAGEADPGALKEELGAVRGLGCRAAETLTALLALARRPDNGYTGSIDLNQTVRATLDVVRSEFRAAGIEIDECYGSLPGVSATSSRLQQAFLSLFVNALHAMPDGGQLSLRTLASQADWVQVEIADSRGSVPPRISDHGFSSFGVPHIDRLETGLGLAAAERIIRGQGGLVTADEDSGVGTRVCVRLPIAGATLSDLITEPQRPQPETRLAAVGPKT